MCVVLAFLAGVSAFFSGMETALFSINGFQVRRWREREPMVAEQFEKLMLNSRSVLSVILLTDTLVNIPLIILALVFVDAIPAPVPSWVKTLVIFGLIVFVCDLLPKVFALADPFLFTKSALGILAVVLGAIIAFVLTRSIVAPLRRLTTAAQQVARGDISATVDVNRADELGDEFEGIGQLRRRVSGEIFAFAGNGPDGVGTDLRVKGGRQC